MKKFKKISDIKVGAVGYGASFMIARQHLNEMKRAGMTLTCVTDIDKSRLVAAKKDFPEVETYDSVASMLKHSDVDLVCIATPHNTHAQLAIQCMNGGLNVVTEKPFAITTQECDNMIAARDANGVMLSTYHNRHWDGWILSAVDNILKDKIIGDVIKVEAHMSGYGPQRNWWRSSFSISGGIMYDWGAHLLEYSLQLLNGKMTEVSGFNHRGFWAKKGPYGVKDGIEDEAFGVIRFDSGQWLSILSSSIDSKPREGWLTVTGTLGQYIVQPDTWKAYTHHDGDYVFRQGPVRPSEGYRFYENIAAHLTKGTKLVITPEYARRPIHILDLVKRSAAEGHAIPTIYG